MNKGKDLKILKMNVESNVLRICQLLNTEGIEEQLKKEGWYSVNKDNVELRQRLKMLRKETLQLEKILLG